MVYCPKEGILLGKDTSHTLEDKSIQALLAFCRQAELLHCAQDCEASAGANTAKLTDDLA